jgi:hypothetical protein
VRKRIKGENYKARSIHQESFCNKNITHIKVGKHILLEKLVFEKKFTKKAARIFKFGKRFRFAHSFNKNFSINLFASRMIKYPNINQTSKELGLPFIYLFGTNNLI